LTGRDPLVAILAQMARLLLSEFDIEDVLSRLCEAVTGLLPVDGAGVTQIEADRMQVMRSTDPVTDELERLQASLREGPCRTVVHSGEALQVDLTEVVERWPRYALHAQRLGIRRIVALPLWGRDRLWGVLDLYQRDDRPLTPAEMEATQVLADAATVYVISAHDRRAADLAEERLRSQLLHDPLTGLANRLLLADRLEHALSVNERPARSLAVLFIDLDGFKRVNDLYGHHAGDVLLTAVAGRLVGALRHSDTVARLSGDEFVILCENLHDRPLADQEDLAAVGQRVLDALRVPIDVGGAEVTLQASVGAVWARGTGDTADDVLHRADTVMYAAKRAGGNRVVVSDRLPAVAVSSTETEADLDGALERGELRAVYQRIVPFTPGGPMAAEALLRWEHPARGLLAPGGFLPAAERSGAIVAIGRWVLDEACATLGAGTPPDAQISVNVAPSELRRPDFVAEVVSTLERNGVEAPRLILEITETALVSGNETMLRALHHLAELGVGLALDDFGTGYSSFTYLKQLPATILKIDPLFVAGIGRNSTKDGAIIRAITGMGHDLRLRVIAEGIETEDQRAFLVDAGCDAGQGWLFGPTERDAERLWAPTGPAEGGAVDVHDGHPAGGDRRLTATRHAGMRPARQPTS
jgi:diguanylate cyclase (GGDEF)-like protein